MNLRRFRQDNNLTQTDVADYLGVKKAFISKIENGSVKMPEHQYRKLLDNGLSWDTRALIEGGITAMADNGSRLNINSTVHETNSLEVEMLRERIKQLEDALSEAKSRNDKYLGIIEKMADK